MTDCNAIGTYLDVDGFVAFKFTLEGDTYRVYRSVSLEGMPDYQTVQNCLESLSEGDDSDYLDVFCNYPTILKKYLLNHWKDDRLRIRSTDILEDIESYLFSLFSVINNERLMFADSEDLISSSIAQISKINRRKLKAIYEGSDSLAISLYAVLHSLAWVEVQRMSLETTRA